MRDPERIDKFLAQLGAYWKMVPDWRFGQLICNIPFRCDPFYLEEDEFLNEVAQLFNQNSKK